MVNTGKINNSMVNKLNDGRFICESFDNHHHNKDHDTKTCIKNLKVLFKHAVNNTIDKKGKQMANDFVLSQDELNKERENIKKTSNYKKLSSEEKKKLDAFFQYIDLENSKIDTDKMLGGGCGYNSDNFTSKLWFSGGGKKEHILFGDSFDRAQVETILRRHLMNNCKLDLTEDDIEFLKDTNRIKKMYGGDGDDDLDEFFDALQPIPGSQTAQAIDGILNREDEDEKEINVLGTALNNDTKQKAVDFYEVAESKDEEEKEKRKKIRNEQLIKKIQFEVENALPPNATFVEKIYYNMIRSFQKFVRENLLLSDEEREQLDLTASNSGVLSWQGIKSRIQQTYEAGKENSIYGLFLIVKNPKFAFILIKALKILKYKMCFELNIYMGNIRLKTKDEPDDIERTKVALMRKYPSMTEEQAILEATKRAKSDVENPIENLKKITHDFTKWALQFFNTDSTITRYLTTFDVWLSNIPLIRAFSKTFITIIIFCGQEVTREIIFVNLTKNGILDVLELINPSQCFEPIKLDKDINIGQIGQDNINDTQNQDALSRFFNFFQPAKGTPAYEQARQQHLPSANIDDAIRRVAKGEIKREDINTPALSEPQQRAYNAYIDGNLYREKARIQTEEDLKKADGALKKSDVRRAHREHNDLMAEKKEVRRLNEEEEQKRQNAREYSNFSQNYTDYGYKKPVQTFIEPQYTPYEYHFPPGSGNIQSENPGQESIKSPESIKSQESIKSPEVNPGSITPESNPENKTAFSSITDYLSGKGGMKKKTKKGISKYLRKRNTKKRRKMKRYF